MSINNATYIYKQHDVVTRKKTAEYVTPMWCGIVCFRGKHNNYDLSKGSHCSIPTSENI